MDENLPIDINTSKLVDWLVSRRHVKKNWAESVQKVRKKINHAIQDMPEHPEITKLLSGAYINYFHCLQIIEILRETEKDSKNIFGWYTSQRMKDWQEVIKLYETDNVYLAEASQYLVRNIGYEIPSLKKQMAKCRKLQEECDKKIEANLKNSGVCKERYFSACKKIGVSGENLKEEIVGLLKDLPEKFVKIARKTNGLAEGRCLYEEFINFIDSSERNCLPLLKFVIEHGDATVYEWKYGESPISTERIEQEIQIFDDKENEDIDFELVEDVENIDFGDDINLETGDIDWGDMSEEPEIIDQIDFGENTEGENSASFSIEIESSGVEGGVAKGEEAFTVLMNETTRTQFISEMMELEGFLTQRMVELEMEEDPLSMSLFSNAPKRLQYQNVNEIQKYLDIITNILKDLNSTSMQHLYMINSSPRYVNRLIETLKRHLVESEKTLESNESLRQKREDLIKEEYLLSKHMKLIISRTRELQDSVEKQISLKYNNREVNLMGGIKYL